MTIPSPRAQRRARIEIIPLIDIIFFLLATFVLVSLSMVKNKGIPVNLPVATSGAAQERQDSVVITITKDGEFFFNKEPIPLDQIPDRLRQFRAEHPDPVVFINGDDKANFGHAIGVLDEVRKLGISKVAIETKPRAGE